MLIASLLDYLDVLRWPIVLSAFLGFFLWRYREHLGRLLDRIQSVKGPLGTGLDFEPQHVPDLDEDAEFELFDADEELLEAVREEHCEELGQLQQEHQAQIDYLINQLALRESALEFERIDRAIYGSQFAALRTLNASPAGVARVLIEVHLVAAKQTFSQVAWFQTLTFEAWFDFLHNSGLAQVAPDGSYRITAKGMAYLVYIDALPPRGRLL